MKSLSRIMPYVAGSYYESVNGISGGGLKLTEVFEAQLEKTGVHVYRGQEVTGMLLSSDGAFCGLILKDGTQYETQRAVFPRYIPTSFSKLSPIQFSGPFM